MRLILSALLAAAFLTTGEIAIAREKIGTGRLFTNDFLGDNRDRWRSGAYAVSQVRGFGWNGTLPERAGEILEYRFRSDIIAPDNLTAPSPGDRRYVGALSFGVHTQFQRKGFEFSLGADMVVTGPQTGIGDFQTAVHDLLGAPAPSVLANQIPNGFHPTVILEAGRNLDFGAAASVRPFIELQAGVETLARVGADLHFGQVARGDLMIRDVATGQRYRATKSKATGWSAVLGGDIAWVSDSVYLPSPAYTLTDSRKRLRGGIHWQGEKSAVFYGVTWLGEEFTAQPEGQVVGSLRLDIKF